MAEASTWPVDRPTASAPPANGRRYTPADRDAAFQLWYATAGRSCRQTAAILGVALDTIQRWHADERWDERAETLTSGAVESVAAVARAMVAPLFVKAILAVHDILTDPTANANARVRAAELAAGWNGLVVPKAPQYSVTQTLDNGATATLKLSDLASLPPDQLAALRASGYLPPALPDPADPDPE